MNEAILIISLVMPGGVFEESVNIPNLSQCKDTMVEVGRMLVKDRPPGLQEVNMECKWDGVWI